MNRKGAIPIPYIIALIFAVIILGVIGYWFFVASGQGGGKMSEAICKAKAYEYCSIWSNSGYVEDGKPKNKDFVDENPKDSYAKGCESYSWAKDVSSEGGTYCKNLLGQT